MDRKSKEPSASMADARYRGQSPIPARHASRFSVIVAAGDAVNPLAQTPGKRGRRAQSILSEDGGKLGFQPFASGGRSSSRVARNCANATPMDSTAAFAGMLFMLPARISRFS